MTKHISRPEIWKEVWNKDVLGLSKNFPTTKSEDFLSFPLTGLSSSPLPLTSSSPDLDPLVLSSLDLPETHPRLVVVDGELSPKLSRIPDSLSCSPRQDYDDATRELYSQTHLDYFKALGLALRSPVLEIDLLAVSCEDPLHLVLVHTQEGHLSTPHVHLRVAQKGKFSVHLHLLSIGNANQRERVFLPLVSFHLNPRAHLMVRGDSSLKAPTSLFAYLDFFQEQDSHVDFHLATIGEYRTRWSVHSLLRGVGSEIVCDGAALVSGPHQCEWHTRIVHQSPQTTSEQFFKAIAQKGGFFSFHGDVHVLPHAKGVKARQLSKNLLLDSSSTLFSRPKLHVEHDELECSHGSTIGSLSEQEIFYLRSRGISQEQAQELLLTSFLAEVLERFEPSCVGKGKISAIFQSHLSQRNP